MSWPFLDLPYTSKTKNSMTHMITHGTTLTATTTLIAINTPRSIDPPPPPPPPPPPLHPPGQAAHDTT